MTDATDITLLDGATGMELKRRGVTVPNYHTTIWSALALMEAPGAVRDVHRSYFEAGADVVIANNYAVTPVLLAREGLEERTAELTAIACALASEARDAAGGAGRVAGSMPPLDTSFRWDLVRPFDEALPLYRRMAAAMAPAVDLVLCETMSTAEEGRAAATAAAEIGKPVWLSWTLRDADRCLRGGDTVAEAVAAVDGIPVEAFLFNCCATDVITRALPGLKVLTDKPIGAYANDIEHLHSQEDVDAGRCDRLDPAAYADIAAGWVEAGASIVGGCCGTGPEHIAAIRARLTPRTE